MMWGEPQWQTSKKEIEKKLFFEVNLSLLEPHLRPRTPPEDGEGPCADLAFFSWRYLIYRKTQANGRTPTILLLGHTNIWVVTQAGLAENREVGVFPVRPIVWVGRQGHRHLGGLELDFFKYSNQGCALKKGMLLSPEFPHLWWFNVETLLSRQTVLYTW